MRHANIKCREYSLGFFVLSLFHPSLPADMVGAAGVAVHYCDRQGISAIKDPVFQPERQHG